MKIDTLQLNHAVTPIVVATAGMTFSWKLHRESTDPATVTQTAFQLVIADATREIWRSPEVQSAQTINNYFEALPLAPEKHYTWQVSVQDNHANVVTSAPVGFFTTTDWAGIPFISAQPATALPVFTRQFTLHQTPSAVASAILYVSGLGAYAVQMNHHNLQAIGDERLEILNPGWTDYHTRINYQAYDVQADLKRDNHVNIPVGKGYFLGRIAQFSNYESLFTDGIKRPLLIFKLVITYTDGQQQTVTSAETDKWAYYDDYRVVDNDIYDGETIDFRLAPGELQPVVTPPIDQAAVRQTLAPSHEAKVYELLDQQNSPVASANYRIDRIGSKATLPLGAVQLVDVHHEDWRADRQQRLLFDFGQNMAATLAVTFHANTLALTKIEVRTGEILNDGQGDVVQQTGSDGPKNTLHHRNLVSEIGGDARSAEVFYTQDEKVHTVNARWTFHGYRYVEVVTDGPVTIQAIQQIPVSSLTHQTAWLQTNNAAVNRLIKNIQFSEQSNYLSIPIDSPNRAERAGWTADAQIFAQSGLMGFDSVAFLGHYLKVINQTEVGSAYQTIMPQSFLPKLAQARAAGWSDIGIVLPWRLYQFTGDKTFVTQYYPQMTAYMRQIGPLTTTATTYDEHLFGDWLGFAPAATPFMNLIYRAYTAQLMTKMARVVADDLGQQQYAHLFKLVRAKIQEKYVADDETEEFHLLTRTADQVDRSFQGYSFVDDAETGLLWFLKLQLFTDETQKQRAIATLKRVVDNHDQTSRPTMPAKSLAVGFLGINVLLPELSAAGLNDQAYDLLLSDQNPSWLLAVKNGATTLWERWDSYTQERGISPDAMNSYNHYAYGSIAQWLYATMLGINVTPSRGEDAIVIAPKIDRGQVYNDESRITTVTGEMDSVYGPIKVAWQSDGAALTSLKVTIPVNTQATLKLPLADARRLNLASHEASAPDSYELTLAAGTTSFGQSQ